MKLPALLLTDPSPHLRQRVLLELLAFPPEHPEVVELEALKTEDPLVKPLLENQEKDGALRIPGSTYTKDKIASTSYALKQLTFLGYNTKHPVVARAVDFLYSRQRKDGSWPLTNYAKEGDETAGYSMIPLQTALPLCSLAMLGLAAEPRAEAAYAWLLKQKLEDGTWPTGIAGGGVYGGVGGYRRMPHSQWGCRTNSTEVLWCFALHPERRRSPEAVRLLDLLLSRETRERYALGFEAARLAGIEPHSGYLTYHARFDPGLLLELCTRTGADTSDPRVEKLVEFIKNAQGEYGLWEYTPNPLYSRWISFYLFQHLVKIGNEGEWQSTLPRIQFQSYPKRKKRY